MGLFTGIAVYLVLWWIVLFTVLPWGVRPPDNPGPGHVPSAPANPRLRQKFVATTLLAGVFWGVVFLLIEIEIVSFRDLANRLAR